MLAGNGAWDLGQRTARVVLRGIMDIAVPLAVATLIMSSWTARTHADAASDPGVILKPLAVDRERLLVPLEEKGRRQRLDFGRTQRVTLQGSPLESSDADGNRVNIDGTVRAASSAAAEGTEEGRRRIARKLGAGVWGGLGGGLFGTIGGTGLAALGGGGTPGFGGGALVSLGGLLGFAAGAAVGVSRVDPVDQLAGSLMGSLLGFGAGIGLTWLAGSPSLLYLVPVASLAGAVGLSEHSRHRGRVSGPDQGRNLLGR